MNILDKIIKTKITEIENKKHAINAANLETIIKERVEPCRDFIRQIKIHVNSRQLAMIAELKKASPSKGLIREEFDPVEIARAYEDNGATCLSVLTDVQYFQGNPQYIRQVKSVVKLPILRKDFIIDEYQILETRALGADAVLLIVSILDDAQLMDYAIMAHDLGMGILVEVHNLKELERALKLPVRIIGVNNRNLKTFNTSLDNVLAIKKELPEGYILVSESGIETHADIKRLQDNGVYAFLVGTTLMSRPDVGAALTELIGE